MATSRARRHSRMLASLKQKTNHIVRHIMHPTMHHTVSRTALLPISRESFDAWAKKNNWLPVNEGTHPQGRQTTFVTPSGSMVFVIYDLKGNLHSLAQPMPLPPQAMPQMPKGFQFPR